MKSESSRREFLTHSGLLALGGLVAWPNRVEASSSPIRRMGPSSLKISLNAYSFNQMLRAGEMSVEEMLEFCAEHDFDAVDLTGYYLENYPEAPSDAYLNEIKRKAYLYGLAVSGTGVRNNFSTDDAASRRSDRALIEKWLEVARKLGAGGLRIFAGREVAPGEHARAMDHVVDSIRQCVGPAEKNGVILLLQNHYEFIRTPDHILEILERVDSPWLAVHLDIGSFRSRDPYGEVERVAPYAAAWQIKETVYVDGKPRPVDLERVVQILRTVGYRGYIDLETLGEGDPRVKVPRFLEQLRAAIASGG